MRDENNVCSLILIAAIGSVSCGKQTRLCSSANETEEKGAMEANEFEY
jgi:hypothetical protein